MAFADCIRALNNVAGRSLSDEEVSNIFERVHKAALDIKAGREELQDVSLGKKTLQAFGAKANQADALFQQAASRAARELVAEAALKKRQAQLQVVAIGARLADLDTIRASGADPVEAVEKTLVRDYSGKYNVQSLEQRYAGIRNYYGRKLLETWDALGNDFLGFFQDEAKLVNLIRELKGEDSGDALAKKGARAFLDTAEEARQHFNSVGAKVGRLDDWGMPQHHAQEKVSRAAELTGLGETADPNANRDAWVNFVFGKVKGNSHYVDDFGNPWTDDVLRAHLAKAWDTIATDGLAKQEAGRFVGTGKRANRGSESRQIHFNSAQDLIDYWNVFGNKSAVEILTGHVERMAKDISFVEHYGPNPDQTYRTLRDAALKQASMVDPQNTTKYEAQAVKLDQTYRYIAGQSTTDYRPKVSRVMDGIAQLNSAAKLGGAAVASFFGDKPMYEAVSHMNDIPAYQRWSNELALLNPANKAERRAIIQQGMMAEGVRSGLNRFYEGLGDSSWTGKVANAVMRATGMTAINDLRKHAFGMSMFDVIGREIQKGVEFDQLPDSDVRLLRNWGITKADWRIWKLAKLEDWGGNNRHMLTPDAIANIPDAKLIKEGIVAQTASPNEIEAARRDATVKLLGAVNTESDFAIVTPGWKERAQFYSGLASQRGTFFGEITRSFLQFKSFPWTYFQRSMDAIANQPRFASKAGMVAWLTVSTTLAGAMVMQAREMLAGKDPRKMAEEDWMKFWGAAFLQGGALGVYGDFLYNINQTRYGTGPLEMMAGPTIGPTLELLTGGANAAKASIEGRESHYPAQVVRYIKGMTPGSNIWYAKAAMDHLIWQQVMEAVSPGYLSRMEQQTAKDFNQQWYWKPGQLTPERAPDLAGAVQ